MTGRHDLPLLPRFRVSCRRHGVIAILLLLTGPAVMTMADLHWRTGYDEWKICNLALFSALFPLVALGATQAIMGFAIRRTGGDPFQISNSARISNIEMLAAPTAIVMPICNEDVGRVIDGLRVISYRLIARATRDLFQAEIAPQTAQDLFEHTSANYETTEKSLLRVILQSPVIHVDETRLNILGVFQYVWVMTDGSHVVFRLTEAREADFLHELLDKYTGTVVSDFYAGYDSLPCRQQKCLAHLIRDINEDLWKNPFNGNYEQFVACVRDFLVPIFSDIAEFGLKTSHLRKHIIRVKRFYRAVINGPLSHDELIAKYQKRFMRYRDSLFTFLEHNGVPWNNNAAERAIRHLAVQRKISNAFSEKGANHYLRFLAIAQTCRFQEKSFLGFLNSGLKNADAYHEKNRRRKAVAHRT